MTKKLANIADRAPLPEAPRHAYHLPNSTVVPKGPVVSVVIPPMPRALRLSEAEMPIDVSKLAYRMIRPRSRLVRDRVRIAETYRCWLDVWSQTLQELDNVDRIFSDDFTRQDEIGALFYGQQCVGLSGFRWVDLSMKHFQDDTYFRAWPERALEALTAAGSLICIGSNLTVLPTWRGLRQGFSVKEILLMLAVRRFLSSDADAMVGTMRNDKGMNGLVYRLGAAPIATDVVHHGVNVDLVTFQRQVLQAVAGRALSNPLAERLWTNTSEVRGHAVRAE